MSNGAAVARNNPTSSRLLCGLCGLQYVAVPPANTSCVICVMPYTLFDAHMGLDRRRHPQLGRCNPGLDAAIVDVTCERRRAVC